MIRIIHWIRAIHENSDHKDKPFVVVNQVKLLRVVQETAFNPVGGFKDIDVDVRIISATNKKLEHEVIEGYFRRNNDNRPSLIPLNLSICVI
ncbi:MAG: sigma 54-interacting transcriptional regulator [Desulfobacula sp.]|jgi:transcriptional regulator with GAF, ATPase, and Fis domain|nr:sigma 54-interacting transcriptional regulator [Desulfobacula sp.]